MKVINEFLIDLKFNNNRPWFQENKEQYEQARTEFNSFIDQLIPEIKKFDRNLDITSSKECVFRIYRDVRFSQNKEPYKAHFGAYIAKGGRKSPYAGYYLHFEPDSSFLGGGVYRPESGPLKAIRTAIYKDPEAFKAIINSKKFRKFFPELYGESLKTAPKGFPKDFPDLDLIRRKHFVVSHPVENTFWEKDDLLDKTLEIFRVQSAFNSYLNKAIS